MAPGGSTVGGLDVKDLTAILGRYSDILFIASLFPVLSHVRFGGFLRRAEARRLLALEAEEAKKDEAKKIEEAEKEARKEKKDAPAAAEAANAKMEQLRQERAALADTGAMPPSWAILLIALVEVVGALPFFAPAEHNVDKAIRHIAKVQRQAPAGFAQILNNFALTLQSAEVYNLARHFVVLSGLGGVAIILGHQEGDDACATEELKGIGLARDMARVLQLLRRWLLRPRAWALAILVASFSVTHRTKLVSLFGKSAMSAVLAALAQLLRGIAFSALTLGRRQEYPVPLFCLMQAGATIARMTQLVVYERLSVTRLQEWREDDHFSRGTLAMEAICLVLLLSSCVRKPRYLIPLFCMFLPCYLIVTEADVLMIKGSLVMDLLKNPEALPVFSVVFAVVALFLLIAGGISSIAVAVLLLQILGAAFNLKSILEPTKPK